MKIKLIDYSADGSLYRPVRMHDNDAGADVYSPVSLRIPAHATAKIPLGFGLELPDGLAGYIFPRSGLSSKGLVCELPPIDSGYRGEIHAIVSNISSQAQMVNRLDRIGQLVIMPVILADFVTERGEERGIGAFASTGR